MKQSPSHQAPGYNQNSRKKSRQSTLKQLPCLCQQCRNARNVPGAVVPGSEEAGQAAVAAQEQAAGAAGAAAWGPRGGVVVKPAAPAALISAPVLAQC